MVYLGEFILDSKFSWWVVYGVFYIGRCVVGKGLEVEKRNFKVGEGNNEVMLLVDNGM